MKIEETRKVAIALIHSSEFAALFTTGAKWRANTEIAKGLPKDAKIQFAFVDPMRGAIGLMIESDTFKPVKSGLIPPIILIEVKVGK